MGHWTRWNTNTWKYFPISSSHFIRQICWYIIIIHKHPLFSSVSFHLNMHTITVPDLESRTWMWQQQLTQWQALFRHPRATLWSSAPSREFISNRSYCIVSLRIWFTRTLHNAAWSWSHTFKLWLKKAISIFIIVLLLIILSKITLSDPTLVNYLEVIFIFITKKCYYKQKHTVVWHGKISFVMFLFKIFSL